jgi:hypothetical protein
VIEMNDLMKQANIPFLLFLVIPGFISVKVWKLLIPTRDVLVKDYIFEIIAYTLLNYALLFWLYEIALKAVGIERVLLLMVASVIGPVLWPIAWKLTLNSKILKGRLINPVPKAWDHVFGNGKAFFVLIHLLNGNLIGGLYIGDSFTSSYPADEDIYLSEVWRVSESGKFENKIDGTYGLLVSSREIQFMEFFKLESDLKEG